MHGTSWFTTPVVPLDVSNNMQNKAYPAQLIKKHVPDSVQPVKLGLSLGKPLHWYYGYQLLSSC